MAKRGKQSIDSGELSAREASDEVRLHEVKVLVATSIGEGKGYVTKFWYDVLESLQGADAYFAVNDAFTRADGLLFTPGKLLSLPPYEGPTEMPGALFARCSRVREAARQYFLAGDWDYLYFHDADMIPPIDIIPRLLSHGVPMATGIYLRRGAQSAVLASMPTGSDLDYLPVQDDEAKTFDCPAFGLGCMLIDRATLERTAFKDPSFWANWEVSGEDWQFCQDSGVKPLVDATVSCWHVNHDGRANKVTIGEPAWGLVLTGSAGHKHLSYRGTSYGMIYREGGPRFDIPQAVMQAMAAEHADLSISLCPQRVFQEASWQEAMDRR